MARSVPRRRSEPQENAALLDPRLEAIDLGLCQITHVGQYQHGEFALQKRFDVAAANFVEWRQGPLDVVGVPEQGLFFAFGGPNNDADRPAAPALVEEDCGAGG
jgi:hypothetical protein